MSSDQDKVCSDERILNNTRLLIIFNKGRMTPTRILANFCIGGHDDSWTPGNLYSWDHKELGVHSQLIISPTILLSGFMMMPATSLQ